MSTPTQDAAFLASVLPLDHPLAQVARLQMDAHVRAERKHQMTKVESPAPGFSGDVCGVTFKDGVAHTDDPAALNYFQGAGYKVAGEVLNVRPTPAEVDSRDVGVRHIGRRLSDALAKGHRR